MIEKEILSYSKSRTWRYFNFFHNWRTANWHWNIIWSTNIFCISLMKKKYRTIVHYRLSISSSRTTRTGARSFHSAIFFMNSISVTDTFSAAIFSDPSWCSAFPGCTWHNRFSESETLMSQDWPCLDIDQ